jgi:hypothetical protein
MFEKSIFFDISLSTCSFREHVWRLIALNRNQIPAPFSSASALFAEIAFFSTAFISSSAFGGSSGRSL